MWTNRPITSGVDARRAGRIVGRQDRPPDRGADAEHLEVVAGDDLADREARAVVEIHRGHHRAVADDGVEHVVARLQIAKVRVGRGAVVDGAARIAREHVGESIGRGNRQRLEQQRVDDREQRRVEADPDRQRGDRHQRKRRTLGEPAQGETDVGDERGEQGRTIIIPRQRGVFSLFACTLLHVGARGSHRGVVGRSRGTSASRRAAHSAAADHPGTASMMDAK
jgi:hypothetical protein